MSQFAAHRNANPATCQAVPYLLDIQNDLLEDLTTRVVVPLQPAQAMQGRRLDQLMPVLHVDGQPFVMVPPQLAGVPRRVLGEVVADLAPQRDEIIAALDFLVVGI